MKLTNWGYKQNLSQAHVTDIWQKKGDITAVYNWNMITRKELYVNMLPQEHIFYVDHVPTYHGKGLIEKLLFSEVWKGE
jgi:hypothetical protein